MIKSTALMRPMKTWSVLEGKKPGIGLNTRTPANPKGALSQDRSSQEVMSATRDSCAWPTSISMHYTCRSQEALVERTPALCTHTPSRIAVATPRTTRTPTLRRGKQDKPLPFIT
jgi:hypothetical protein